MLSWYREWYSDHVYEKSKKQLERDKEGWYETGLVWEEGNLPLGNNKNGSLGRLKNLVRNLKRDSETHKAYDTVIQEQVQNKIIESVSNNGISNYKEFYLPHKPVIRKKAELTKYELFMTLQWNLRQVFCWMTVWKKGPIFKINDRMY